MAKHNHGFTCTKHWKSVLVDRFMIIHQLGSSLCDSDTFDDAERLYDRKGIRTLTPLDLNLRTLIKSTHLSFPSKDARIRHMLSCGYTKKEIEAHLKSTDDRVSVGPLHI